MKPRPDWNAFYEDAWRARHDVVRRMVEVEGERDLSRVLGRFEQFEQRHLLRMDKTHLTVSWTDVPRGDGGFLGFPWFRTVAYGHAEINVPYHMRWNHAALLLDIVDHRGPFDAIVELGCGYGRNLFRMYLEGGPRQIPYIGGELSASGIEFARYLNGLAPEADFRWHRFDHLKPDLSFLPPVERLFVFTCHSIEQVADIGLEFFACVAGAAPQVTVVHLEPCGFQAMPGGEATQRQAAAFARHGWNLNLVPRLREAADAGLLELEGIGVEIGTEDASSPTSAVLWTAGSGA